MKNITILVFIVIHSYSFAQHIQYRDKAKPLPAAKSVNVPQEPVVKNIVVQEKIPVITDTISKRKTATYVRENKKMPELITGCKLSSPPGQASQLPVIINNVSPEMVAKLKERYKGRLYSITGLNMIDVRLKLKLRICDNDGGNFRIEYLDKDGNVVHDAKLDYYEF